MEISIYLVNSNGVVVLEGSSDFNPTLVQFKQRPFSLFLAIQGSSDPCILLYVADPR